MYTIYLEKLADFFVKKFVSLKLFLFHFGKKLMKLPLLSVRETHKHTYSDLASSYISNKNLNNHPYNAQSRHRINYAVFPAEFSFLLWNFLYERIILLLAAFEKGNHILFYS